MALLRTRRPCGAAFLVLVTFFGLAMGNDKRPVYMIAHMINSIPDFDNAMAEGANAIEADVTFSDNGTATKLYHGAPCDCFRWCHAEERIRPFLNYVRLSTNPCSGQYKHQLSLLFLDLKVGNVDKERKYAAGVDIAQKLLAHLWHRVHSSKAMNVLLSVPSVSDLKVLQGAIYTISKNDSSKLDRLGFDVSDNEDLDKIRHMYKKLAIQRHRWQGDGITNCLSFLRSAGRLDDAIDNRDSRGYGHYVDKVYDWTVDMPQEIRRSLRRGVDGIITNSPQRMARILLENEFMGLRLANVDDSPWTRFLGFANTP